MTFVPVADPLLDSGKPIRSTDIKQMRDNQADHESRVLSLEDVQNVRISSHFVKNHNYASGVVITGVTSLKGYDQDWYLETDGAEIVESVAISATADNHYLRLNTTGGNLRAMIVGDVSLNFDQRVKPLTFISRQRHLNNADSFIIGFAASATVPTGYPLLATLTPTSGCWLEKSGANWHFAYASAGAVLNGTDFAPVAASTWFEVKIIFTDTPSDRFLAYLNGTLKETFTTAASLPTGRNIFATVKHVSAGTRELDIDRIDCYAGGPITDMP
jgi:hypothetical protein